MRAMTYKNRRIEIAEVPMPVPGPGQLLVRTLACAVCASDHHYVDHPDVNAADKSGMRVDAPDCDVIMGHEFCAEIVDYGPDCQKTLPIGTRVTSIPVLMGADQPARIVGYSPEAPGGYGEYFLLTEFLAREIPDTVPVEHIAVNDALAVGWFYSRAGMKQVAEQGTVHLVIGCGAIGASVIAGLKLRGAQKIIAADLSAERRAVARELGADVVVDPREESPFAAWRREAWGSPEEIHDRVRQIGLPTQVVYECAGVKGVLTDIAENCAAGAYVLSAGGSHVDEISSTVAHLKGLIIQWGGGPEFEDWYGCLDMILDGKLDPVPFIGETIGLDGLPDAFERARSSSAPLRIVWKADND
ncbi:zinc-binding dehydrogenase [Mycolicibacterium sp.]|uniref:zinc-binding dehydrogenase n=1 Tax=Mycolicibacterium sp. TaxID=2320850 RepID=UPI00355E45ED